MRCALLTVDFPPMPSGLGRAAFEVAKSLQQAGCDVTVFDGSALFGVQTPWDGLAVVGCAPPPDGIAAFVRRRAALGHLVAPYYFRKAFLAADRACPFDVVEATNWYAPAALLGHHSPPLVVRNSTPAIDALPATKGARDLLDLRAAHWLEARTTRNAAATISNTQGHRLRIERDYRLDECADHAVISLALDPATLAAGRSAPPPPLGAPRLLFVGRAERRKGFAEALGAFAKVAEQRASRGEVVPALDLVGVDPAAVGDNALARHITVYPKIDDHRLHALYAGATLVLAPSRYESFGLVYREAAAFGRPLVACAEDPAACEFVAASECGVLAAECTRDAIAAVIEDLLAAPASCERLRRNGLATAATLSRDTLGRETLAVYRRAIDRHARA
ncbi:glycosyltransferase family 4 protein [Acuticoccus sp. MNP-M23]|uniref:glycosyltransferase family 4 protein n=1 Tax=Acuticoccus sp. MNP-M23 TaxID=3072793 RepID=UPI0028150FD2|nr:glycosyltransferase family 4 protein [Acuticoccus sp. MNP-M23]WMS44542.1 glycosyltransferase family 4 protein [Acuticoccus sp. MNP-M23]